ncbi:MAG: hypothetical protein RhofKO_27430 [Rhodothermales bacterium]
MRYVRLFFLLSVTLLFGVTTTSAQNKRSVALGVGVGTKGVSLDAAMTVLPSLGVRAGFNYLDFTVDEQNVTASFTDDELRVGGNLGLNNVEVLLDYAPFSKKRFRLVGGVAYYLDNTVSGTVGLTESQAFNDITLTPDEIGTAEVVYSTNSSVAPYIGIGLWRAVPSKVVSFNLELGAYYRGSPQIDITGTKLLRNNNRNEPVLEDNLKDLGWWPVFAMRFGFRLF